MKDKFPRTMVIPAEAYGSCLASFAGELWMDSDMARLGDHPIEPDQILGTMIAGRLPIRRLLRTPFWKRRELLSSWSTDDQKALWEWLSSRICSAPPSGAVRLSRRKFRAWIDAPLRAADVSKVDWPLIRSLAWTSGYAEWLSRGGDADVGRYLGCWAERFWMNEPSS